LQQHYRVIAIDTRGHGRSTLGTAALTYAQAAEDAHQILRHEGVEKYSLFGFSDGGTTAYRLGAEDKNVEKIITVGAEWHKKHLDGMRPMFETINLDFVKENLPEQLAAYQAANPEPDAEKWAAAFAAAACLAVPAGAETVRKLGFVNVDRIYRESVQAQNIQNKLDTEFAPRQQQLEKLQNEIEVSAQKAEKLKAGKARAAAMAELERQRREFRGSQAQLAEEYDLRRNEEFAALQNNANRVILELAKKEGYDLIVHDVIFIDARFDITDKVIREMNR